MPEATRRIPRRSSGACYSTYLYYTRGASLLLTAALITLAPGCARERIFDIAHFDPVPRHSVKHTEELAPPESAPVAGNHAYSPLVIPDPLPDRVQAEIVELQESYHPTFQRGLNRASRYEAEIRDELRKAGLPDDLVYLAMVESMFQEKVVSPAGAGGMWQFIPATARRYQLRIDGYVDERYDWRRNTQAAIQYLKDLHDYFDGRWELAVTAYNMGEGGLGRIIDATGGERDFWKLVETAPACDRIRMESKKYYPRLLAYIIVTREPEKYGFTPGADSPEKTEEVPVSGMYSLAKLDDAMGYPQGTLARLNPDLVREITPPTGDWSLSAPAGDKDRLLACLPNVPVLKSAPSPLRLAEKADTVKYKVKRGDSLAAIAKKYGTSEKAILAANKLKSGRSIRTNKTLLIPVNTDAVATAPADRSRTIASMPDPSDDAPKMQMQTYSVKKGDTLSKIAKSTNISVAKLQSLNPSLGKKGTVYIGQTLNIGEAPVVTASPEKSDKDGKDNANKRYHVVKPGEYPAVIAKMYDLSTEDLLRINRLEASDPIRAGEKLLVAAEKTVRGDSKSERKTARTSTVTHTVAKGETAATIAAKYGVSLDALLQRNKLTAKSVIHVGQELSVEKNAADAKADRSSVSNKETVKMAKADTGKDAKGQKILHTVTKGQNPSTIADKYHVPVSDLFEWNGWRKSPVLKVGDRVTIYKK